MTEREHVLSLDCWCKPRVDSYGDEPYEVHNLAAPSQPDDAGDEED